MGITVVSATSFLVFFSYMSMQNLESSLRPGTGTTAVGVLYFAIICGTPLAPKVVSRPRPVASAAKPSHQPCRLPSSPPPLPRSPPRLPCTGAITSKARRPFD